MIQVTLTLYDSGELAHLHAFVQKMEDRREEKWAQTEAVAAPEPIVAPAAPAPLSEPPPITDAELEAQITSYWKAKGLPAAKEVLARFGVERVGAIPSNRRGEAMLAMATG